MAKDRNKYCSRCQELIVGKRKHAKYCRKCADEMILIRTLKFRQRRS